MQPFPALNVDELIIDTTSQEEPIYLLIFAMFMQTCTEILSIASKIQNTICRQGFGRFLCFLWMTSESYTLLLQCMTQSTSTDN